MKVILQRSGTASVTVDGEVTGSIQRGYVLLVGITHEDTEKDADYIAKKVAGLRLWEDEDGKMNRSIDEVDGEVLSVSPIHFVWRCKKRPSSELYRSSEAGKSGAHLELFQ